jgi:DNA-binding SARP family transcriptional activator/streptogramin lyase
LTSRTLIEAAPEPPQDRSKTALESCDRPCDAQFVSELELRVLGSIEVMANGHGRSLGGPRQRALLAALTLHANEVVSVDRIVDCVWGEAAPPSARHIVQTYVSQLRSALEGVATLRAQAPGYILEVEPEHLDVARWEMLVRDARAAAHPADAASLLDKALALWRGEVAADVPLDGVAQLAAQRLEQQRIDASELRIDALLELGRHRELVQDLEWFVAAEPLRERFRAQLMLALYRSGRQADALAAYREARRHLTGSLGVEPGPELRDLERRILHHDSSLLPPAARSSETPTSGAPRRRRPLVAAVVGAALVCSAVAVAVVAASGGGTTLKLHPRDAALLDARTGRVLAAPVRGTAAAAIAAAGGRAWAAVSKPQGIVVLALAPHGVRVVKLDAPPYSLAAVGGVLWAAPGYEGTIQRIAGAQATPPFRLAPSSRGRVLLVGISDALWVAAQDGYLRRVDPRTGLVTAAVQVGLPNALAAGFGSIWVASASADQIVRVDAATGHIVRRINIGGIATSIASGRGGVWAATPANGTVWRISPRVNAVLASVSPLAQPTQVAAAGGQIWVASGSTGALAALDQHGQVLQRVELPTPAARLAADGNRLWLTLDPAA